MEKQDLERKKTSSESHVNSSSSQKLQAPPSSSSAPGKPIDGPNLMEMDNHPTSDFTGFQGPTDMFSSQQFSQPQVTPSSKDFDNAFSFFGEPNTLTQPAPATKQSILELYNQPSVGNTLAPMGQGLTQPTSPASSKNPNGPKPNYNVVLEPVYATGTPVVRPTVVPVGIPYQAPVLRYQNPAMQQYQQQYPPNNMVPVGYQTGIPQNAMYNPNMRPAPSYVAPSYVNPNHLSALKGSSGNTF